MVSDRAANNVADKSIFVAKAEIDAVPVKPKSAACTLSDATALTSILAPAAIDNEVTPCM